jgi:L-ribulokinase
MSDEKYVIGVDYGTDSVRTLIVDALNGKEIADAVEFYPRWIKGMFCDPAKNKFRQHPLDYIESLEIAIKTALSKAGNEVASKIVGISVDTTGSTPILIDANGTPLSLSPDFIDNPNAMFILWKDHTAIKEAEEINEATKKSSVNYLKYEGGIYSSEWVWAKVLHVLREDEKVRDACFSWIEHCDWIPALLTGQVHPSKIRRGRCSAGHKAMWHEEWCGLPPKEFFHSIDPLLAKFDGNLFSETFTSNVTVGTLTKEWAERLGLPQSTKVGVGAFDCHMGAVGGNIKPNELVRVMGTSTCDILISSYNEMEGTLVDGICGQVDGSVIPGYIGLEAGQSAFGDLYAWFKNLIAWPVEELLQKTNLVDSQTKQKLTDEILENIIPLLSEKASKIPLDESTILALDWINGRRTPDANQSLKGAITGLTLGSDAPHIFRALVEATAFGSKAIVERFENEGVKINKVIAIGGVAKKSPFVMQTLANVLNMPIEVVETEQACALGAAIFAAVASGVYPKVEDAQKAMCGMTEKVYNPDTTTFNRYSLLFNSYIKLGYFFEKRKS